MALAAGLVQSARLCAACSRGRQHRPRKTTVSLRLLAYLRALQLAGDFSVKRAADHGSGAATLLPSTVEERQLRQLDLDAKEPAPAGLIVAEEAEERVHFMVKDELGLVSEDPEVVKHSLPQANGVSGADVPVGTSADGARGAGVGAEVPTRSTAQAAQTKGIDTRATKGKKVVAAAGDRPFREQEKDELFVLFEADFLTRDRDGDGVISPAEFRRVGVHRSLSKARVDKIFREADAGQDGVLSFSEYLDAVSNMEGSA